MVPEALRGQRIPCNRRRQPSSGITRRADDSSRPAVRSFYPCGEKMVIPLSVGLDRENGLRRSFHGEKYWETEREFQERAHNLLGQNGCPYFGHPSAMSKDWCWKIALDLVGGKLVRNLARCHLAARVYLRGFLHPRSCDRRGLSFRRSRRP